VESGLKRQGAKIQRGSGNHVFAVVAGGNRWIVEESHEVGLTVKKESGGNTVETALR